MSDDLIVLCHTDKLYVCRLAAVHDILFRKLIGCGDDNGADLEGSTDKDPCLGTLLHHHHYAIALLYAESAEGICAFIGKSLDIRKGIAGYILIFVNVDKRLLFGHETGILVHYVVCKIEVFGNFYFIVFLKILIRVKLYSGEEL